MKKVPGWIKSLLVFALVYLTVFQPIPYYIERPGSIFGLNEMVEVAGETGDSAGEFYITTVGFRKVTPLLALSSLLPYQDLVSEKELVGDNSSFEEYDAIQQYYMESASNTAIQVAFDAADIDYELDYNGVYVLQVIEESDFKDVLQIGDVVQAVDDQDFQSSHDFIEYISNLSVGDTVTIEYIRKGEEMIAIGELILLESGVAGIGIGLVDHSTLQTDPQVNIHSGAIGGPSAGLMFSLQIYNQLVDEDILGANQIAGTGTIAPDGTVGRIGGAAKKVVAAEEAGVQYFLAPDDEIPVEAIELYPELQTNYEEALEAAQDIDANLEVIPIKTFSDALEFLNGLLSEEAAYNLDDLRILA